MSTNVLGPVVASFITDVTAALIAATVELSDVDRSRFEGDVTVEAFNLSVAVIDADGRHTADELEALLDTFVPLLPDTRFLGATPATLQGSPLVEGTAGWLDIESELFRILVESDERNGTRGAQVYYERALDIAHVIASLDVVPSTAELEAISNLRSRLLHRINDAGARVRSRGGAPTEPPAVPVDPEQPDLPPPRPLEDLLAELDELVGLSEVKARVHLVADFLYVQRLRRERDLPTIETSHHLVFTGNPGTGKTTVARLLAQIYRTLGVVKRGHLVETDRAGLVAGYVGQTAPLVTSTFDKADEGILFIDEAYSLARGGDNDFGREAIDQIVKLMEDRRDRVVLIVAGYPVEMEEFISANPGLRSRFPTTIEFPDYSNDELLEIVEIIGAKSRYTMTEDAREKFMAVLDAVPRGKGFGNARVTRNIFEAAVARQASRIRRLGEPDDTTLTTLEAVDIAAPERAAVTEDDSVSAPRAITG